MNTIFSYNDILIENIVDKESNAGIISLVLDFLSIQDELPNFKYTSEYEFELTYGNNGFDYKILCKIENGNILIRGLYRSGSNDDLIEFDLDPEQFEMVLRTRNIYQKFINKIIRIVKRD